MNIATAEPGTLLNEPEALAGLHKALGDPLRLELLRALGDGSYSVLELCELFDCRQPSMSHHLKVLANVGLVTTRREGNSIFYRRTLPAASAYATLLTAIFANIDILSQNQTMRTNLQSVHDQRAERSRDFFTKNAKRFREHQDMIAEYEQYADSARAMVEHAALLDTASVMEIGPGEGKFLTVLSQFSHVYAIDNSETMLEAAKRYAEDQQLTNIEFVLGEAQDAISKNICVDAIVMNMVLHHVPNPREHFLLASTLLNDDGHLIVTDLSQHDQSWAHDSCGDQWLGFDTQELISWASDAGLTHQEQQFLGLRNGFQVQLHRFTKAASVN